RAQRSSADRLLRVGRCRRERSLPGDRVERHAAGEHRHGEHLEQRAEPVHHRVGELAMAIAPEEGGEAQVLAQRAVERPPPAEHVPGARVAHSQVVQGQRLEAEQDGAEQDGRPEELIGRGAKEKCHRNRSRASFERERSSDLDHARAPAVAFFQDSTRESTERRLDQRGGAVVAACSVSCAETARHVPSRFTNTSVKRTRTTSSPLAPWSTSRPVTTAVRAPYVRTCSSSSRSVWYGPAIGGPPRTSAFVRNPPRKVASRKLSSSRRSSAALSCACSAATQRSSSA